MEPRCYVWNCQPLPCGEIIMCLKSSDRNFWFTSLQATLRDWFCISWLSCSTTEFTQYWWKSFSHGPDQSTQLSTIVAFIWSMINMILYNTSRCNGSLWTVALWAHRDTDPRTQSKKETVWKLLYQQRWRNKLLKFLDLSCVREMPSSWEDPSSWESFGCQMCWWNRIPLTITLLPMIF